VKASVIRRLATDHESDALEQAIEALIEREEDVLGVDGEDAGEKLTHCNLALRIRQRVERGEDPKEAFRAVMKDVRAVLTND
jgi:hypothetical protein